MFLTLNLNVLSELYPLLKVDTQNLILAEFKQYNKYSYVKINRNEFNPAIIEKQLNTSKIKLASLQIDNDLIEQILTILKENDVEASFSFKLKKLTMKNKTLDFDQVKNLIFDDWFNYYGSSMGVSTFNNKERTLASLILTYIDNNKDLLRSLLKPITKMSVQTGSNPKLLNWNISDILNKDLTIEDLIFRLHLKEPMDINRLLINLADNNKKYENSPKETICKIITKYRPNADLTNLAKALTDVLLEAPYSSFQNIKNNTDFSNFEYTDYINKLYNSEYIHLAPMTYQTLYNLISTEIKGLSSNNYWEEFTNTQNYLILTSICLPAILEVEN